MRPATSPIWEVAVESVDMLPEAPRASATARSEAFAEALVWAATSARDASSSSAALATADMLCAVRVEAAPAI